MQDTNPNRQNDHRGLLDDLAASAGCLYVSDLRGEQNYASERAFVEQSGAEDYTLREWRMPSVFVRPSVLRGELRRGAAGASVPPQSAGRVVTGPRAGSVRGTGKRCAGKVEKRRFVQFSIRFSDGLYSGNC